MELTFSHPRLTVFKYWRLVHFTVYFNSLWKPGFLHTKMLPVSSALRRQLYVLLNMYKQLCPYTVKSITTPENHGTTVVRCRDASFHRKKINFFFFSRTEEHTYSNFLTSPLRRSTPQIIFIGIKTSVRFRITIPHQNRFSRKPRYEFSKIEFCMKKCKIKQFQIMEIAYVSAV